MIAGCRPTNAGESGHKECKSCLLDGQSDECRSFRKRANYKLFHVKDLYIYSAKNQIPLASEAKS
jgi:hypothetical protein